MEACCSRFTAAEGGARLAAAAGVGNTLAVEYSSFIATRLVHEDAYKIRGLLSEGRQRSVYVTRTSRVSVVAYELNLLTDLSVARARVYGDVRAWSDELDRKEVIVCTSAVLKQILEEGLLAMTSVNVLILDSCHLVCKDDSLQYIMKVYKECEEEKRPRILALTYPLFASNKKDSSSEPLTKSNSKDNVDTETLATINEEVEPIVERKETTINETEKDTKETKEDTMEKNDSAEQTEETATETKEPSNETKNSTEELKESRTEKKEPSAVTNEATEEMKQSTTEVKEASKIKNESTKETTSSMEIAIIDKSVLSNSKILKTNIKDNETPIESAEIGVYENLDDFDMYEKLEWKIEELEKELCCQMDLAEDIDGGKRLSATITKPKELIIEYSAQRSIERLPDVYIELEKYMKDTVRDAMGFIEEHRYDPTEIYGEDLYEEFMNIPNPTIEPRHIFKQFLYVLEQLGPYAADKAAFTLLTKLEKLKIKVPYERHFLLLCLCTSVFVKIRCYADLVFSEYESDWEKIQMFCTPKVLRFTEILEKFQPPGDNQLNLESAKSSAGQRKKEPVITSEHGDFTPNSSGIASGSANTTEANKKTASKTIEMLKEIDSCDFITLSNRIEDTVNTYEANLKDIEVVNTENKTTDNINDSGKEPVDGQKSSELKEGVPQNRGLLGFARRTGHRARGRGRVQRNNAARVLQMQQNPDALCGIVFMKEALMAKIMFLLIVDMSRCHPKLSYLCAQFCAIDQPADPGTEPRECQRQGKKQEDVLKKFRMHECNILLATSAVEEGIDLPRCNLVLRWDVPASYRSYGLCRGRARAARAACALLSRAEGDHTSELLHNVAVYRELDQIISRKCGCGVQDEPTQTEEDHADSFTRIIKPYTPNDIPKKLNDNGKIHNGNEFIVMADNDKVINGFDDETSESEVNIPNNDKKEIIDDVKVLKNQKIKHSSENASISSNCSGNNGNPNNDSNVINDNDVNTNVIIENVLNSENNDSKSIDDRIINDNNEINELTNVCDNNDNLFCNKCNSKRNSVNIECPCVSNVVNVGNCVGNSGNINKNVTKTDNEAIASVDLSTAIALINRYCGKLPSDTFTRLAPQWWMERVALPARDPAAAARPAYICTLRLPLNCPVKYNIVGHPMPTRVLARRMVALQACRILHKSGELDNQLMPIGKENFKAAELENASGHVGGGGAGDASEQGDAARPGTTKRRQYYFKRTAWAFTDCQPVVDSRDSEIGPPCGNETHTEETKADDDQHPGATPHDAKETKTGSKRNMLYAIVSKLWCALPERYNTRGRRLHAPQHASQAIGILMARDEPDNLQIPAFPVYTRSGEVRVSVEHVPDADVRVSPRRGRLVRRFMRFVFAEVLRVRRRGMRLQSDGSTHNNYYIVPTIKTMLEDGSAKIDIDWSFLELIYQYTEEKKHSEVEKPILWHQDEEEEDDDSGIGDKVEQVEKEKDEKVKKMENPLLVGGETFLFDAERYREAVVTPWYRNQDQPQFFLVAEICWNLTPDSAFPSATHTSFRHYYSSKYGVALTQSSQPLLDVDHTSARLNLLTPRYVNRKGVALPVSSERTRRAKRDRLDQKQILVPELCRVHPFAAPLWFATVALPCVLYRINALLIADEIRRAVSIDVGLGIPKIDEINWAGFQWPPLDFGWSLAEVLSADSEKIEKKKEEDETSKKEEEELRELDEDGHQSATDDNTPEKPREKTLNDILQEEVAGSGFEIGTWSNDMASSLPQTEEYDEYMEPLPSNLTFCTSASGGTNWCDPIQKPKNHFNPTRAYSMADSDCSYMSSDFDTDDSDLNSEVSDEDTDTSGFCSSKNVNAAMGVRIEYKTAHEAEAVDVELKKKTNPAPQPDERDDALDRAEHEQFIKAGSAPEEYIKKFRHSVDRHKEEIIEKGHLIHQDKPIVDILPETKESQEKLAKTDQDREKPDKTDKELEKPTKTINEVEEPTKTFEELEKPAKTVKDVEKLAKTDQEPEEIANKVSKLDFKVDSTTKVLIDEIFPYGNDSLTLYEDGQINLESIEKNKRRLLAELRKSLTQDEVKKLNCFSMVDVDIDSPQYINEKVVNVGFDTRDSYTDKINGFVEAKDFKPYYQESKDQGKEFDFDDQPKLEGHPGPSPSVILQALTMSNANDGINLERLETIGDSFLKFAITAYLYCAHPTVHEGKLSHMRSKQVSNLNLYRLGRNKRLGARMIASKFEPHDNWLPPCHKPPSTLHPRMPAEASEQITPNLDVPTDSSGCFIPYNLITQHSIPDKSIADCVEALIGAYLLECGPRGALLFMSWLGIRVLPRHDLPLPDGHPYVAAYDNNQSDLRKPPPQPSLKRGHHVHRYATDSDTEHSSDEEEERWGQQQEWFPETDWGWPGRPVGSLRPYRDAGGLWRQPIFGELKAPPSPLLRYIADPEGELEQMLSGYDALERTLQYRFKDRSLLLQAMTHASHQQNRLTDCYQRLEFLGDAILDYLITRHLYEDPRRHSPGALTDLRSALVNNTIFATLAARHGFHKYFRHMSPGLNEVLTKYVRIQEENGHSISEEHYLIQEDEMEQAEDVEVPKALGDLFESVAGAIFLDSGMSLGAVWRSYVNLMGAELEAFSAAAPKSPVRELLEAEPDTAKFGKPERLADGRRVRVCVEVFGRGAFKGVGRNYRIAKGTAARCALRHLRNHRAH